MDMKTMKRQAIYESEDIKITQDVLDGSPSVIVFFSNFKEADWQAIAGREDNIRFRGHSAVFVSAKTNHWWQIPDLQEMCACIRSMTEGYAERISYGSSMGGYGALLLSSDIASTRVLAVAPQSIISDPDVPLEPAWAEAIAQRPILRDNVAESMRVVPEILYDPHMARDLRHVDELKSRVTVEELRFPYGGHKLLNTLKECGILRDVVSRLFQGKATEEELLSIYDPVKRSSASYVFNVAQALVIAGEYDTAEQELATLDELDPTLAASLRSVIERRKAKA
ncbi:hypothetical protein [Pararhodobacter marinus]